MTVIYDESSEAYHANPAIGSGDIRAFLKSPRLFRDHLDGIYPRETKALAFGIASHMAILEPNNYAASAAVKPDGMSFSTNEGKEWRAQAISDGRIIVPEKDHGTIRRMHDRMPLEVREVFDLEGRAEVTVRRHNSLGMDVQCRIDWLYGPNIWDLKTINDMDLVDRAIWKHSYHIQAEWYRDVAGDDLGEIDHLPFRFIFAEKNPPYRWRIVELDDEYREAARKAIADAVHGIVARTRSGCWDDPAPVRITVTPPPWIALGLTENEDGGIDL